MLRTARIFVCIGLALAAGACMGRGDTKAADEATARFYQEAQAGDYQAIYNEADPGFRTLPPAAFAGFMARIARKMGPCQPPIKTNMWRLNVTNRGAFRAQGYSRACANGRLDETVTIAVRRGQARLFAYNAANPLLLTD